MTVESDQWVEYGCVSLRMRFFPQNFGTIKRILPGSSSPSHREGPGIEVAPILASVIEVKRKTWRISASADARSTPYGTFGYR